MNVTKNKLSSNLKEKSIDYETIFDHNPTEEELEFISESLSINSRSKEEYLKEIGNDPNKIYASLFNLYQCRYNATKNREYEKIAQKYFNKIAPNIFYNANTHSCLICSPHPQTE